MIASMSFAGSTQKRRPSLLRPSVPIAFEPELGDDARVYRRLVRAAESGTEALRSTISSELSHTTRPATQFALLILRDILQLGGTVWSRDSRLLVSWPDWSGVAGRHNARRALEAARDDEIRSTVDLRRVTPLFL